MKQISFFIPLLGTLLLSGCAGTSTEFECNATTSDTCMTMEQANEKAKKLEQSSEAKPVAASLPRLAEGNFRTMPVQTVTATTPSGSRPAVTAHPEQKLLAPRPLFTAAREVKTVVPVSSVTPVTPPRPLRTGEQTAALWIAPYIDNLADWKVVLFMQGHCPYCHQFDPVLKQLAQQYGFSVFSYTLDGQGDTAFPEALPVPPEVMQTFFPNIPVATPTTFLVNVNTLEALPLLQGATDAAGFMARVDTVLQMYGGKKGAK